MGGLSHAKYVQKLSKPEYHVNVRCMWDHIWTIKLEPTEVTVNRQSAAKKASGVTTYTLNANLKSLTDPRMECPDCGENADSYKANSMVVRQVEVVVERSSD